MKLNAHQKKLFIKIKKAVNELEREAVKDEGKDELLYLAFLLNDVLDNFYKEVIIENDTV